MPKIRGVKPELWTDENFVELSPYARLLWIGLWNHACDNGHVQDKSKQIKMRVLPTDEVNAAELLREIETQGLILREGGWITIPNLPEHQKPHKHWFVLCDKPGCIHPPGMTYGIGKTTCTNPDCRHGSTVEQPLINQSAPVEQPVTNGGSTADVEVDGDVELMVIKSKPETDVSDAPKSPALIHRQDVEQVCEHLAGAIEANGSKRPVITTKWRTAARLMLDKDGRGIEEIHGAIDWCQRDEFWRANVLSMPTLREKFDQLRLQAQRQPKGIASRADEWKSMQERQMARAIEREREMGIR